MRDEFTHRLFSVAVVAIALAFTGAVIYQSITGQELSELVVGLASLTIGALLPSPLQAQVQQVTARIDQPASDPIPVVDTDQPRP